MAKKNTFFRKNQFMLICFFFFISRMTFAQITVKGEIVDETGEFIPGVSILEKGTSNAVISDANGKFTISVSKPSSFLVFTAVSYQKQEVNIGNNSTLRIMMLDDIKTLDDVVVIGYGTTERKDLTGAISSISEMTLKELPVVSAERALQGRVAGVQVSSNTGQPGGGVSVRIRGVGTVNNNEPLYVIDGVPIFNDPGASASGGLRGQGETQNPLAQLNSNDIASIEILKDASATAIYGARANNGVVIITTKRGKEGKLNVGFETFQGFSEITSTEYGLMDSPTWAKWYAGVLRASNTPDPVLLPELDRIAQTPSSPTYDWASEVLRKGKIQNYQLNLSGGNKTSQFYMSGNFYDENGVFINSGFKRYSLRFNADHTVSKRVKVGNTLTISKTDQRLAQTDITNNALFLQLSRIVPSRPIYTNDGRYSAGGIFESNQHPIAYLQNDSETLNTTRLLGSLFADVSIAKGLTFRTSWSADQILSTQQLFSPPVDIEGSAASRLPVNASLTVQNRNAFTWFTDNYFTYAKAFKDDHNLSLTAGTSSQLTSNKNYNSSVSNFLSGGTPYLSAGINQGSVSGGENRNGLLSYFARGSYSFKDKYLLTATVRRDGSSRFGKDNRFGTFPAVSAGWRISNESFMSELPKISNLKLRASWGLSGGQEIGDYSSFSTLRDFNVVIGDQITGGFGPSSLANSRLQWEATEQSNFGIDLGILNNRVSFTADYFIRNTTKLLLRVLPPVEQGAVTSPFGNLGEIQNKGIELSMSTVNINNSEFRWTTDLNFSSIKNRVVALAADGAPRLFTPFNSNFSTPTYITRVGDTIGAFYLYETNGIFGSFEQIYSSPVQNTPKSAEGVPTLPQTNTTQQTSPGDLIFRDTNGDGVITPDDRVIAGKTIPDFTWGVTNNFTYKGFSASIFFMGVQGVSIYNGIRAVRERMNSQSNQSLEVLKAWTPENQNTTLPRATIQDPNQNNRASTRFLEDGSFARLKNLRLAYDLPSTILEKAKINKLQVYVSGVNLLTFTKYTGYDPELGSVNQSPEFSNYDAGQYPLTKQYMAGLRLGL